jgi:hypothetical protein
VVQPNFDRLSCAFARLISIGSATSFEVHSVRREVASFTSFYLYSLSRGGAESAHRLLDERGELGLVGLGQLLQGVSDRPHGAVVEVGRL